MTRFNIATLSNGLRLIHIPANACAVYCGYVVCAGTRDEQPDDAGMAHFIEHMSFKGTSRRRAFHIVNGLERVGGELNAYTNKQETVYTAAVLPAHFDRAADLLTDLVFHSTYPQHEIDREVEVICDEIDSYRDTPSELIFDEFEAMAFRGHPLGRDILGSPDRLRAYRTADARRFADEFYRPSNAVFYVSGDMPFSKIEARLSRLTSDLSAPPPRKSQQPLPPYVPETRILERGTHQAHVMIGRRTFGPRDPRHCALLLLNNVLGGPGMNSRLNVRLREQLGLVYSIDSYVTTYPDASCWNIYFGCDKQDVLRCRRAVASMLREMKRGWFTEARLAAARRQLKGQMGIAADAFESQTVAFAKQYARYGAPKSMAEIFDEIDSFSFYDLDQLAREICDPEQLSTLVYQ